MRYGAKVLATVIVVVFVAFGGSSRADDFFVIPFDVDPPIVIDGDLDDWANVPNVMTLNQRANVTYGADKWTGPADLSAGLHLAWRPGGLYVAADVTDDAFYQVLSGKDMFKGDHITVFMDTIPGVEPRRTAFGRGQFQFGLSPGSLGRTEGGMTLPPEIYIWVPAGASQEGGEIVARKTDKGYLIEAFVPWRRLKVTGVRMHKDVNFEFAVSDTDAAPPSQDSWMTISRKKWTRTRPRLVPMVFGDGNGKAIAPTRLVPIKKESLVPSLKTTTLKFNADAIPKGKLPYLFFQARFHFKKPAGWAAAAMRVELNGKRIRGDRISNRPRRSMSMSGKESVFIAPDGRLAIPYTPSGRAFDRHAYYGIIDGVKGCEFEFNVAGLLKEGENTIVFHNLVAPTKKYKYTVTLEDIELRIKARAAAAVKLKPAPTGPLPVIEPQRAFPKTYRNLTQKEGRISFKVGGEAFSVAGRFSAPDGKWHKGPTRFYKRTRKVIEHDEWIEVRDTFTNLTDKNVPIMQVHSCTLGEKRTKGVWLSCIKVPSGSGRQSEPSNPTVFAATAKSGVGMVALNDIFRVHSDQSANKGTISLADRHFVLKGGGEYTAEWAIVPVTKPDMWAFVNATRRLMDANFTLKYMSAFLCHRKPIYEWSEKMFKGFIERKSANVVSQGIYVARYRGRHPQGLAFHELSRHYDYYRDFHKRLHKLFPDGSVKHGIYYHCFLDVMDENKERFKDCRRIDAAGNHMNYSGKYPYLMLYVPTLENGWGRAIGKGIDIRLDTIGCDYIYWDEYNQSRGSYTYNMWDGCSADIDRRTFKIKRTKGAVHLISLGFLRHHIKRIMDRGVPLVCNGAPMSRTLARLKFQNFVETGSISNCHRTLLHTPVALGDHLTERSLKDAYEVMLRALDWGCLYNWYSSVVIPTHKTITEHMFPFTPIELHSGCVIGKERILTNRSGLFGWGDKSVFTCYVYDRLGRITDGKEAKRVTRNGKTYAEVRIPEGYSAAIVRK